MTRVDPTSADTVIEGRTSAVSETFETIFTSAMEYGCVGDGLADDTAALQSAIDTGYLEVYVPKGTYLIGSTTNFSTAHQRVYGPGTLKAKVSLNSSLTHISADGVTLDGLTLDGNSAHQASGTMMLLDAAGVTLRDVTFNDAKDYSIHSYTTHAASDDLLIDHCTFASTNTGDVLLEAGGDNVQIRNSVFTGGPHPQVWGDAAGCFTDCSIIGNSVRNTGGVRCGIETLYADRMIVSGNTVDTPGLYGITVGAGENCVISGNTVNAAHDVGIELCRDTQTVYPNYCSVTGNTVRNTTGNGFGIALQITDGCTGVSITGNTVLGGTQAITTVTAPGTYANLTVTGNVVVNPANCGFWSLYGILNGCTISGNTIAYGADVATTNVYGIYIYPPTSKNCVISGNVITYPSAATINVGMGISVDGPGHLITGNRISGNSKLGYGIVLATSAAGCLIEGNVSTLTTYIGLSDGSTTSPYNTWIGNHATAAENVSYSFSHSHGDPKSSGKSFHARSSAPDSGLWVVGDVIFNTAPTGSGGGAPYVGWVCTTAGVAGSGAVFKMFGAVTEV